MGIEAKVNDQGLSVIDKNEIQERLRRFLEARANMKVVRVFTKEESDAIKTERSKSVAAIRFYHEEMAYKARCEAEGIPYAGLYKDE